MRPIRLLLVSLVLLAASWACADSPAEGGPDGERVASAAPRRLIAVAPSVVEILFALDLGDRVVGVGDYVDWPPAAAALPRIGGLFDPRFETIVALDPELAILLPSEERLALELRRLGLDILSVRHETISEVEESIVTIAQRLGVAERGRRLARELAGELAPRHRAAPLRVLMLVGRERGRLADLTAVGSGTFLSELAERAGARSVFADVGQPYPRVNLETLLERQPQVVIELQPEGLSASAAAALVAEWQSFPDLEAVARGCVSVVSGSHVLLPGPRLPRLLAEITAELDACDEVRGG